MKLVDANALITGGSSGIGFATARLFIKEGARVAIVGRNRAKLDAATKELGSRSIAFEADVTNAAARKQLFSVIGERLGLLDIVFANAGISRFTPADNTPEHIFEEVINVNLNATFFTVQSALPYLRSGASIVLNGSTNAKLPPPGNSAYAASKAGVRALARALAADLSPRGIRVNVVVPGPTLPTNGMAAFDLGFKNKVASTIPMGRWAEADEVAKAVLFLACEDSSYVQGAELVVDGGCTASNVSLRFS